MTKISIPNKPGDFEIDGVSIIILPDKVIVDTCGKSRNGNKVKHTYVTERKRDISDDDSGVPPGGLFGAIGGTLKQIDGWNKQRKGKE